MGIYSILDQIEKRPALYIGGADSDDWAGMLRNLELVLVGYELAVSHHKIVDDVDDFRRALAEYLHRTRGWSASAGPFEAIRRAAGSDAEAWQLLWAVLTEFRNANPLR